MVPEAIVIDALGSPVANVSVVIFAPDNMAQVMSQDMFSRRGSAAKSAGQKVRLVCVFVFCEIAFMRIRTRIRYMLFTCAHQNKI